MSTQNKHLESIKVQGFKSIKTLSLAMEPINILIGANGSGKSNFLSLFTFLQSMSEGKLNTYVQRHGYGSSFFHFGPKKTPVIEIETRVDGVLYHVEFEHAVHDDGLIFSKEYCELLLSENTRPQRMTGLFGSRQGAGLNHSSGGWVEYFARGYLQHCRNYHFHDTGPTAAYKQAIPLDANSYLYADASNVAAFLYQLKHAKDAAYNTAYSEILEAIQTVAPYFHDFYLVPTGSQGEQRILLKWLHRDYDTPFSANQLSDGTARFICMATLLLQPQNLRPKTILLDEPELGLHPAALEVLAEIIKVTARQNQVICSTQSITFANQFKAKDFIVVDQEDGSSVFKRVNEKELSCWLDDYAMGDIWNKNLIGGRPEW